MARDRLKTIIIDAIHAGQADGSLPGFDLPAFDVLHPKQPGHGDYTCNAAMVIGAAIRKTGGAANPREIAQAIVAHLPANEIIGKAELAGPGFINMWLADVWLQQQVPIIAAAGAAFGNSQRGAGQHWQVEFVSANPSGPIHYGGARNAVLGAALANVLEASGYTVQREFYVNDGGTQFQLFAASLYARYAQLLGRDEALPEDGYQGEYMMDYAQQVVDRVGDRFLHLDKAQAIAAIKPIGREIVLAALADELARIGVVFDRWFSEQSLYDEGLVEQSLDYLDKRGELERRDGAIWFKASQYPGCDKDEVVVRSNGLPTYLAGDIAYHYDKFIRRQFDTVVDVWAVDHQGHVPRMKAIMAAFGLNPDRLIILLYDLVKLVRDGKEVKLSKRKGNLITIDDVVDEVGSDALHFNLLTRGPESVIEFDLDLAVAQNNENPVYYVQYSHARICSILVKAANEGFQVENVPGAADVSLLGHPSEFALIRKLLELEEQIDLAVEKLSPHNLVHYSMDLAKVFSGFYRDCRVVDAENRPLSDARLLLCRAAGVGLHKVLSLVGVSAPQSM
jgi:arginyl-tRNA synthetase